MNNQGMSTVEAAMIVPLVLFIIMGFIYVGFALMDIATVFSAGETVSVFAAESVSKCRDLKVGACDIKWRNQQSLYADVAGTQIAKVGTITRGETDGRLVLTQLDESSARKKGSAMAVKLSCTSKHPVWTCFKVSPIRVESDCKVELGDFANTLRKREVLEHWRKDINGEERTE